MSRVFAAIDLYKPIFYQTGSVENMKKAHFITLTFIVILAFAITPNVLASDCEEFVIDRGVSGVKIIKVKKVSDARSDEVMEIPTR